MYHAVRHRRLLHSYVVMVSKNRQINKNWPSREESGRAENTHTNLPNGRGYNKGCKEDELGRSDQHGWYDYGIKSIVEIGSREGRTLTANSQGCASQMPMWLWAAFVLSRQCLNCPRANLCRSKISADKCEPALRLPLCWLARAGKLTN